MRTELAEGFRYVLGHRYLRPVIAGTAIVNLFWNIGFAIHLVYFVRELGLTPGVVGLVLMLGNAGWLAGALMANRFSARWRVGPTIIGSALLFGPSWLVVGLAPEAAPVPFLAFGWALGSFGGVLYNITTLTLRQSVVPEGLQGRMVGVARTVVWGTIPLGSVAGGVLASTVGLREAILVAGLGAAMGCLPLVLSSVRALDRMPGSEESGGRGPAVRTRS